jgi:pyridinium-3,5-biscarboxylic acid mononucleotide sulfurtransferase
MQNVLSDKITLIETWFSSRNNDVIVALSGGIDSCLVAFFSRKILGKKKVLAVISKSPSLKEKDLNIAIDFCERFDIELTIIETKEFENPDYISNPVNRCYFCKVSLYDELKIISMKFPESIILNGQNFEDFSDYRPGIKAGEEFNILHPLADCKLTKDEIREIAYNFGLPTWNKPASPCLSSRIPYGQQVTIDKLKKVEAAENYLNQLGFDEVRVRNYNNSAKIEVEKDRISELINSQEQVTSKLLEIGFESVVIDNEGFISGKLNRAIA